MKHTNYMKLVLILSILMMSACTKTPQERIIGEWEGELELGQGRSFKMSAEFLEDGNMAVIGKNGSFKGKWNIPENKENTLEKGRMTLTTNEGSSPVPGGYIFSEPDSLRINFMTSRFELKRKE